jgi:hypothetical protein
LRFSKRWLWRMQSSGVWRRVNLWNVGSHKIYTAPHPRRRHSSTLGNFDFTHIGKIRRLYSIELTSAPKQNISFIVRDILIWSMGCFPVSSGTISLVLLVSLTRLLSPWNRLQSQNKTNELRVMRLPCYVDYELGPEFEYKLQFFLWRYLCNQWPQYVRVSQTLKHYAGSSGSRLI